MLAAKLIMSEYGAPGGVFLKVTAFDKPELQLRLEISCEQAKLTEPLEGGFMADGTARSNPTFRPLLTAKPLKSYMIEP